MELFWVGMLIGAGVVIVAIRGRAQLGGLRPLIERHVLASGAPSESTVPVEVVEQLRHQDPAFAEIVNSEPAVPVASVPEMLPSESQRQLEMTATVEEAEAIAARFIPDPDLRRAVVQLARWRTRRNNREEQYQNSFRTHLKRNGFTGGLLEEKPRVPWAGGQGDRIAVPDFILGGRVLVELKAGLLSSGDTDRALGQMLRYLLAWKRRGPAVLAVCGDAPPEIRWLVLTHVNTWRRHLNLPVMVFFKQGDQSASEYAEDMPVEPPLLVG